MRKKSHCNVYHVDDFETRSSIAKFVIHCTYLDACPLSGVNMNLQCRWRNKERRKKDMNTI